MQRKNETLANWNYCRAMWHREKPWPRPHSNRSKDAIRMQPLSKGGKVEMCVGCDVSTRGALRTEAPRRLELVGQSSLREHIVTRKATHAACTAADGSLAHGRDTTAVTADTASIAHCVVFLELAGRRKVQASKCARFTKQVTKSKCC